MQDRGLAAYIAELIGTFFLVFVIGTRRQPLRRRRRPGPVRLRLRGRRPHPGPRALRADHGLRRGQRRALQPGGHDGRRVPAAIDPIDAVVYVLAQLSGAVLGALAVKGLLLDEGRAVNWGAGDVSPLLGSDFAGMVCEGIGALLIVLGVVAVAMNKRARNEWAPLTIGLTLRVLRLHLRPADRRLLQPGPLVRPGAGQQRVGRRLALHRRPAARRLIAALIYKFVISAGEPEAELEKADRPLDRDRPAARRSSAPARARSRLRPASGARRCSAERPASLA